MIVGSTRIIFARSNALLSIQTLRLNQRAVGLVTVCALFYEDCINMYRNRHHAFTLIETLVVLVVIAVLTLLIIGAVLQAREAARRSQCLNNMRQLAIAINAHLDQKKYYPRGENNYSAFVSMLPFLENGPLYNSINLAKPRFSFMMPSDVNETAFSTHLNVFVCPSEGTPDVGLGPSTYGGNRGTGVGRYGSPDNGPFASSLLDPAIRDALVRDGLANTVAISEFCRNRGFSNRQENRAVFQLESFGKSQYSQMIDKCNSVDIHKSPLSIVNRGWCWGFDGIQNTLYDHNIVPNGHTCSPGGGSLAGAWTASSAHAGGVNCVHLDGHVTTVEYSVSISVWRSLGTMNGGEITNSEN